MVWLVFFQGKTWTLFILWTFILSCHPLEMILPIQHNLAMDINLVVIKIGESWWCTRIFWLRYISILERLNTHWLIPLIWLRSLELGRGFIRLGNFMNSEIIGIREQNLGCDFERVDKYRDTQLNCTRRFLIYHFYDYDDSLQKNER